MSILSTNNNRVDDHVKTALLIDVCEEGTIIVYVFGIYPF